MITPIETEDFAFQIVRSLRDEEIGDSDTAMRERLADFAKELGLNLAQTATLYAIAAHPAVRGAE